MRGGTYEGPAIGSFGGVKRGNRIFGGLSLRGLANVEANFYRYSKNPDSRSDRHRRPGRAGRRRKCSNRI